MLISIYKFPSLKNQWLQTKQKQTNMQQTHGEVNKKTNLSVFS